MFGNLSGTTRICLLLTGYIPDILPRVGDTVREKLPWASKAITLLAITLMAEAHATDIILVILGTAMFPRATRAEAASKTRNRREPALWRTRPFLAIAAYRHARRPRIYIKSKGPSCRPYQHAEANAAFTERPIFHETRRIAKARTRPTSDRPARVRV